MLSTARPTRLLSPVRGGRARGLLLLVGLVSWAACGDDSGGTTPGGRHDAGIDVMPGAACDLVKNTGCEPGLACSLSRTNVPFCDRAEGKTVSRGNACKATATSDTCQAGSFCGTVDPQESIGFYCFGLCTTHADCQGSAGAPQKCQQTIYHQRQTFTACGLRCSPWVRNSCPSSEACTWSQADGAVCKRPGSLAAGAACTGATDCVADHICFQGVCRQACERMASGCAAIAFACAGGKTCQQPSGAGLESETSCLGVCL